MKYSGHATAESILKMARGGGLKEPAIIYFDGRYILTRRIESEEGVWDDQPVVWASALTIEMLNENVWRRLGREGLLE